MAIIGCDDDSSTDPTTGTTGEGQFALKLIDSVGPYDEVNIEFVEVSVNRAGDDSTSGWVVVSTDTLTANLLEYTNGNFRLMALSAGEYTVEITPTAGSWRDTTLQDIHVSAGLETDVGVIVLD